ncbi:MAG: hypothetical protein MUO85_02860 [candidate division Zixibacteria bacterium]|nr:hypothetical protein [candidate division Zixibacteria bacterium]
MTDEDKINLALDMIRKGVQQQDTLKISMVSAPLFSVKQESFEFSGVLTKKFQDVFNVSSQREISLQKPDFDQLNPLATSNFWDFDIIDPKIKIVGDSAIVDCELVLWGAVPVAGSKEVGRKSREMFVFKSPPKISTPPPTEEYRSFENKSTKQNRTWQLVGFENLLDFLNSSVNNSVAEQ